MTEYLRHNYSGRVYQVMTDHGEENPYLSSFPYVRTIGRATREKFFKPCGKPYGEMDSNISFHREIEWEKAQRLRDKPLKVEVPDPPKREKSRKKKVDSGYTLGSICEKLGISTARARKVLRGMKKKPQKGWVWSTQEEVEEVERILRNL